MNPGVGHRSAEAVRPRRSGAVRILGIELRRSAAVWVGLLVLAVGAALLLTYTQNFAARWMQLAFATRVMLFVMWPLALAGGAWMGRRDRASRVGELFATAARPRWQRVLPTAVAVGLAVAVGYVVLLVVGAGFVLPTAEHFPGGVVAVVAAGAVSLVAAAWLGLAAGRALPWLATAPSVAVLGVIVVGLLPDWATVNTVIAGDDKPVPAAVMLSPVYAGGVDDFQRFATGPSLVQMLWLAGVAATGLLLFGVTRPAAKVAAVLPAALGLVAALAWLPAGGYAGALRPDRVAMELVCDDSGPQVCVTTVHASLLPDVTGPVREALALIATKLPDAPTRAVESDRPTSWVLPGSMPDPRRYGADTLTFLTPSYNRTGGAAFEADSPYRETLLGGMWEPRCDNAGLDTVGSEFYLAQQVATAWLLGRPYGRHPDLPAAYERFTARPVEEQRAAMAAARAGVLACDTDALVAVLA